MTRCDAGYDARDGACDDAYVSHRRVTPTVAATVQWFHQLSAKSIELKDLRPSGPAPPHTPQAQSLLTFCSSHVVAYLGYDKDTLISFWYFGCCSGGLRSVVWSRPDIVLAPRIMQVRAPTDIAQRLTVTTLVPGTARDPVHHLKPF